MSTISLWEYLNQADPAGFSNGLRWLGALHSGVQCLIVPPAAASSNDLAALNGYLETPVLKVDASFADEQGAAALLVNHFLNGGKLLIESDRLPWLQQCRYVLNGRTIQDGDEVQLSELEKWFDDAGYRKEYQVEAVGEWSRRGGVLDVWAPGVNNPVRFDFWGNTIERIRVFDPSSQLSFGVKHQVDMAWLKEDGADTDSVWPLIADSTIRIDGRSAAVEALRDELLAREIEAAEIPRMLTYLQDLGDLNRPEAVMNCSPLVLPAMLGGSNRWPLEPRFLALRKLALEGRSILVSARSHRHRKALKELAEPYDLRIDFVENIPEMIEPRHAGQVTCWTGPGLPALLVGPSVVLLDESAIVGGTGFRPRKVKTTGRRELNLNDLQPGDAVVHEQYGVGCYEGLIRRSFEGVLQEFLKISYEREDSVLLPVDRIYLLDRLVLDKAKVKLDRLGTNRFQLRRSRAKEDAAQYAAELIRKEARQATAKAPKMKEPAELVSLMEASFPWILTADQERVIEEIYAAMLFGDTPMDRLLVGDVGFGKTEVALRAVALAVENGYQTIMLAPTTILAYQHYRHFAQRMRETGAVVSFVNRFRGAEENRKTMREAAAGKVDVLIGTHRVLQRDLHMPNLGLVVVDEEHKFGVAQKDRIQNMRAGAHRLAMSATPIPRSLNMALGGSREISTITTAPPSRQSVETVVVPFDETIVRSTIERELKRKGQVFVVTPRIAGLDDAEEWIRSMVPYARIGVGHGQLSGTEMEHLFLAFWEGEIDVLISTSIVESGLDVVNANTIVILQAHRFGLADLYQLRGRVGRSDRKAYCVLVVPVGEKLTPDARGRIDAIERFSRLGSGYQVALYDLETRGAGELLGRKQSGHLQTIGMSAYARLLQEAISEQRNETIVHVVEPEVRTWFSTALPEELSLADVERLEIYRQLHGVQGSSDWDVRAGEVCDRYNISSDLLQPLEWLSVTRGYARRIGATVVDWTGNWFRLQLSPESAVDRELLVSMAGRDGVELQPDALILRWKDRDQSASQWQIIQPFLARLAAAIQT